MILKCDICGNEMLVGNLTDGQGIRCPQCGEVTLFRSPTRIRLPHDGNSSAKSKLYVRRPQNSGPAKTAYQAPESPLPDKSMKCGPKPRKVINVDLTPIITIVLAVLVIGGGYFLFSRIKNENDNEVTPTTESMEDDYLAERKKLTEEDAELMEKRKKLESEQQEHQEKLAKQQEAERLETARKQRAEQDSKRKKAIAAADYAAALEMFRCDNVLFVDDIAKNFIPWNDSDSEKMYALDIEMVKISKVYEILLNHGEVDKVNTLTPDGSEETATTEFMDVWTSKSMLLRIDDCVWISKTGNNVRTVELPERGSVIKLFVEELGDLYGIMNQLGVGLPNVRYRLSLVGSTRNEKLAIGIVDVDGELNYETIWNVMSDYIKKNSKSVLIIPKPRLVNYVPKVVFYDGNIIVKGIRQTKVPRHYVYNCSWQSKTTAHERWKELAEEADVEAEKKRQYDAEDAAKIREYTEKMAMSGSVEVSNKKIHESLSRYKLLIERSRTKKIDD